MADPLQLATVENVVSAWKPLNDVERERAEYWISAASRALRRRWKDIDARINAGTLAKDDVTDVIVGLVIDILPGLANNGMKSGSVQAGAEARSFTMEDRKNGAGRIVFQDWMVEIFEGPVGETPRPKISTPRPYGLNRIFPEWKEVYD